EASPVLDVLVLLSVSVGLPFLVISATAPLLQRWFTHTGHPAARDPYFLYVASNLGSMLALIGYPTLIEPWLPLRGAGWLSQTRLWSLGYLVLVAMILLCALTLRRDAVSPVAPEESTAAEAAVSDGVSNRRRLGWVVLAFVPSSLLLGATTYITTDIAAVPLLWVLPLSIYLLTFIIAFGRWPARLHRAVMTLALPVILTVLFLVLGRFRERIWLTMLWHLLLVLVVGLACHGELARDRPSPRRLTEFYLWISAGGVLGGLFNALLAPLVFSSLLEYPLVMVLASALLAARRWPEREGRRHLLLDIGLVFVIADLTLLLYSDSIALRIHFSFLSHVLPALPERVTDRLDSAEETLNAILEYAPPLAAAFLLRRRPLLLAVALVSVLAVAGFVDARISDEVRQARSFFGVLRIVRDPGEHGYTDLRHGTTLHGRQSVDPKKKGEPLSYYHRKGPVGQIFAALDSRSGPLRVAVIGLGTGTVAAYARPGDSFTFYEIDRLVRDISWDRQYFTYVADARDRGATLRLELGDARRRLDAVKRERPGERYDLIVVDAFTSDAIPVHLITREALQLYLEMLKPDGIIAFHISNRYLRLEPVVANLALDAGLGGRLLGDDDSSEEDGSARSTWVVVARTPQALGSLAHDEHWTSEDLGVSPRVGVWTDDFHNLLSVFRWR
ncbi:MAG TPA: fused MFS/spermidine synthase, partial [Candidatus Methylomirabilis sp.]|nr:fused MFS/spermidine synthase [Candidatus Methylomirabilis sp.]